MKIDLRKVKEDVYNYCEGLRDLNALYGCYRSHHGKRPDLYASLDVAQMRTIMGEDLKMLPQDKLNEWIMHINSFADSYLKDGRYPDTLGHSLLHANGMVIGALGILGGKQKYPVRLYDDFNTVEKVSGWLDKIDWANQWSASHLFWGGMHCFSFSKHASKEWLDFVINWLNNNIDEKTGWWRKGIPHSDRHQPLGGSVHILPVYQHHNYTFPRPERVIDSVLALQLPEGNWMMNNSAHIMTYLDLDALYAFRVMGQFVPDYRKNDISRSIDLYGNLVMEYYTSKKSELFNHHPHGVLAAVGTFGLLQYFDSENFCDDVQWTDIFSDSRFYDTASVEADGS